MESNNEKDNDLKKIIDDQISNEEDEDKRKIMEIFKDLAQKVDDETDRIDADLPVIKPEESGEIDDFEYICLLDILAPGFKTPEYDEEGHSLARPAFNIDTPIQNFGIYTMVSPSKSFLASNLYNRYTDEPTIIYRELDNRVLYFFPQNNESIAIKTPVLEGYKLTESAVGFFYLEYIYLMMSIQPFSKQFPKGMNIKSLLKGWIPVMPIEAQKVLIEIDRKTNSVDFIERNIY